MYKHLWAMAFSALAILAFLTCVVSVASSTIVAGIETLLPLLLGVALTVFHVSAMWAAIGPSTYLRRFAWSGLLLVSAFLVIGVTFTFGMLIAGDTRNAREFAATYSAGGFVVPIIWIICQLPYLLAMVLLGWRIAPEDEPTEGVFSIREFMIFTAIIAVGLGGIQAFEKTMNVTGTWVYVLQLAIANAIFFVAFSLPAILLVLRYSEAPEGCGILGGVSLGVSLIGVIILSALGISQPSAVIMFVFLGVFFGGLSGAALYIHRNAGFQLWTHTLVRRYQAESKDS